jgi:hypothetical protein
MVDLDVSFYMTPHNEWFGAYENTIKVIYY